jgi:hypothetical protein
MLTWFANVLFGQSIQSGEYEMGLRLAFDSKTKMLTGYFENYTGWDEKTKNPRFSCIFYIEGIVTKNNFKVLTYYPKDILNDTISGLIEINNDSTLNIILPSEHGCCCNVKHFADDPVKFNLEKRTNWTYIKYVVKNKTPIYSNKSETKKQKAYLVQGDFVCIDRIESEWAYCTFYGNKTTKCWIKTVDLN